MKQTHISYLERKLTAQKFTKKGDTVDRTCTLTWSFGSGHSISGSSSMGHVTVYAYSCVKCHQSVRIKQLSRLVVLWNQNLQGCAEKRCLKFEGNWHFIWDLVKKLWSRSARNAKKVFKSKLNETLGYIFAFYLLWYTCTSDQEEAAADKLFIGTGHAV